MAEDDVAPAEDGAPAAHDIKSLQREKRLERIRALKAERASGERPPGLAQGRWLGDFLDQDTDTGLLPAEERLLFDAAAAKMCWLHELPAIDGEEIGPAERLHRAFEAAEAGDADAKAALHARTNRGPFLRFLLLGGDAAAPVHEEGVWLVNAAIVGPLDLRSATDVRSINLPRCWFQQAPCFDDARLPDLNLNGARVPGLGAQRAHIGGNVFLRQVFTATGAVSFSGARIDGQLSCTESVFCNQSDDGSARALNCQGVTVGDGVFLDDGFEAQGQVDFGGATIGGQFACEGGAFRNQTQDGQGRALRCQGASIGGAVFLRGSNVDGMVAFNSAKLGADFQMFGATLDNGVVQSDSAAAALDLQGVRIEGTLWLGPWERLGQRAPTIIGSIDLTDAHAKVLADDSSAWPGAGERGTIRTEAGETLTCEIRLDGFTYDRLGEGDKTAATRLRWLQRQPAAHCGADFRPQPYTQLVKVLREMGHDRDARLVAKEREFRQKWAAQLRAPSISGWFFYWVELLLFGWPAGYGYGKKRLIVALLCVLLAGVWVYGAAARQGLMAPAAPVVFLNPELAEACAGDWAGCAALPKEHTAFNALFYSADVLLPVVAFGQESDWTPIYAPGPAPGLPEGSVLRLGYGEHQATLPTWFLQSFYWGQIIIGWTLSGLLVLALSGVMKSD